MANLSPGLMLWGAGLTWDHVAALCGVTARTVQRWRAAGTLPPMLLRLLELYRDLGAIHPAWRGWAINPRDGLLYSPEEQSYTPGEVRVLLWHRRQITALTAQVRNLQAALADPPAQTGAPLPRWVPARARRSARSAPKYHAR